MPCRSPQPMSSQLGVGERLGHEHVVVDGTVMSALRRSSEGNTFVASTARRAVTRPPSRVTRRRRRPSCRVRRTGEPSKISTPRSSAARARPAASLPGCTRAVACVSHTAPRKVGEATEACDLARGPDARRPPRRGPRHPSPIRRATRADAARSPRRGCRRAPSRRRSPTRRCRRPCASRFCHAEPVERVDLVGPAASPLSRPWVRLASQNPPLRPDAAHPTVRASTMTTRASGSRRLASSAVHRPVYPPPTITRSASCRSAERGSSRLLGRSSSQKTLCRVRRGSRMTDAAGRCRSKTVVPTGITSLSLVASIFAEDDRLPGPPVGARLSGHVWQVGHQKTMRSRVGVGAERSAADQRAAAAARPAFASVHPGRRPGRASPVNVRPTRSRLARIMRAPRSTSGGGIRLVRRRRGQDAAHEEDLVGVLVAEPRDVALVLERDVDCPRVSAPSRRAASPGSQSRTADRGRGGRRGAPRRRWGRRSMSARSKPTVSHSAVPTTARACEGGVAPSLAGPVDVPLALHLQVRVQRVVADPVQQVLAPRHHARAPTCPRRSTVAACGTRSSNRVTSAPGERLVQASRGAVDGVALRHAPPLRS